MKDRTIACSTCVHAEKDSDKKSNKRKCTVERKPKNVSVTHVCKRHQFPLVTMD